MVNGKSSSWTNVLSGIPQGSVLACVMVFADDTKVFTHVQDEDDCKEIWMSLVIGQTGVSKFVTMHYGNQQDPHTYSMSDGNSKRNLDVFQEEKYLGVKFDPTLTFSKHVAMVVKKANSMVGIIRTFDFIDEDMLRTLYKTMVRPHLEYANCIWSPLHHKDNQLMEKVQRRASKLAPQLKDKSYEERLRELRLPTLAYRHLRGGMIQTYKIMHGIFDVTKEALFEMTSHTSVTRGHSLKIIQQHSRLRLREHSFSNRVGNTWNDLPNETVNAPTMNCFKTAVDKALAKKFNRFTFGVGCLWQQVSN
ncbi:uncharacterized protein [Amphiura filiformis]|uniref:uncharacterized protein n=1 Tax=Amphiura filiformis TaxID=82378 RepID=UPI003B212C59